MLRLSLDGKIRKDSFGNEVWESAAGEVCTEYMEVTIYLMHTLKPGPHLNARMQAVVGALVRSGHRCSLIT